MPDQDGFDLIRQLREDGHDAKDLPAVALTAFVQKEEDAQLAMSAGFQVHLPKPASASIAAATLSAPIAARQKCARSAFPPHGLPWNI